MIYSTVAVCGKSLLTGNAQKDDARGRLVRATVLSVLHDQNDPTDVVLMDQGILGAYVVFVMDAANGSLYPLACAVPVAMMRAILSQLPPESDDERNETRGGGTVREAGV